MKLSMLLPPKYDERKWTLARQVGVKYAITLASTEYSGRPAPDNFESLKTTKEEFNKAGFEFYGLEGDQFDMDPIRLGLPNRDEYIDRYLKMLKNMGELDIRLMCYNFMAGIGWYRTRIDIPERGGAVVSEFNELEAGALVAEELRISHDALWNNLFYFLDAILPTAEKYGIQMALHPDDPPVDYLKGIGRIITSSAAIDRVLAKYNSPSNGITLCQGTMQTTGENLVEVSKKWFEQNKVFFLHLRDVKGDKHNFRETFHDNGMSPMAELLQYYHDMGFDGPLRPDHAPTMYGESHGEFGGGISVGYEITGKLFAIGYFKGILEASNISYD